MLVATICYPETQLLDQRMMLYQRLQAAVAAAEAVSADGEDAGPAALFFADPVMTPRQEHRLSQRILLGEAARALLDAMLPGQTIEDRALLGMASARVLAQGEQDGDVASLRREWNAMQPVLHVVLGLTAEIRHLQEVGRAVSWRQIVVEPKLALAWAESAIRYGAVLGRAVPDVGQRIVVRLTD